MVCIISDNDLIWQIDKTIFASYCKFYKNYYKIKKQFSLFNLLKF